MPVWHERTKPWVAEGKLVVIGVAEEQHPDRCRLFMQWHGIDWPMMHDPITKLGLTAVPVITAIDEHGIVRLTRPDPATFEQEFLNRTFGGERRYALPSARSSLRAPGAGPALRAPARRGESARKGQLPQVASPPSPDLEALKSRAAAGNNAADWQAYGDAALLWGGPGGLQAALDSYQRSVQADPKEGANHFRLGVAYRMRYDSPARQAGDFQAALDAWGRALALDPNQYIWRRRIQQYGPRLEKPYPFYGWIEEARAAIRARGDVPVALTAEPTGAEIAAPLRTLDAAARAAEPDPEGRLTRDRGEFIRVETAVAPGQVKAGSPVRLHLVFRPVEGRQAHWNNEAEPLRVWLRLPEGWEAEQRLIELPQPRTATSDEVRETSTELRLPAGAPPGPVELTGYALYNVCEGASGTCLFRRQDLRIRIVVQGKA